MSSTDRQNRLLVAEDWKRVYQSYRNADFQSYDFDNLRRTMINYLRENYPEDFNDYIESSEYIALIDLIAYLGQNLAFRTDLNARENFLELAERRESVLRLARLLSYNPKRNQTANGLLKVESITTTEEVIDSNNTNLENQAILWNDPSNPDWYEQFILILNAGLPVNGTFGRPFKKDTVAGVPTEQYRFNSTNEDVPVFSFNKAVNGANNRFEIVSTDIGDGAIEEEPPFPGNNFALLYRNDGRGNGSTNTGFFSHFRQGALDQGPFTITNPTTNQVVAIDAVNVNDTDVWLYKLDSNGQEIELWSKVASTEGNNVIYNSLSKSVRNFYSVLTRVEDRISIVFSDGVFGNLPKGTFRAYYRTSKNQRMVITPDEMKGISIKIPYISKTGSVETAAPRFTHERVETGNLLHASNTYQDWTTAPGSSSGTTTVTGERALAPDGTYSAFKVDFAIGNGGTSNDRAMLKIPTVATAFKDKPYTASVFLKTTDGTTKVMSLGTISGSSTSITVTGEWQRFENTSTPSSDLTDQPLNIRLRGNEGTATSASVYVWGAQAEAGRFATSYIPTYGATATRGEDVVRIMDDDFTDIFGTEFENFSVVADFDNSNSFDGNNASILEWWSDNNNYYDRIQIMKDNSSPYHIETRAFGGNTAMFSNGNLSASSEIATNRLATSWSCDYSTNNAANRRWAFSFSGEAVDVVGDNTGTTVPALTRFGIGCSPYKLDLTRGILLFKRLMVYNQTLSDNQLRTLSS